MWVTVLCPVFPRHFRFLLMNIRAKVKNNGKKMSQKQNYLCKSYERQFIRESLTVDRAHWLRRFSILDGYFGIISEHAVIILE
jgi:hypothetical protein